MNKFFCLKKNIPIWQYNPEEKEISSVKTKPTANVAHKVNYFEYLCVG